MKCKKTIVLAAGGTGGHFFPAITLATELEKFVSNTHLITDFKCKKYITLGILQLVEIIFIPMQISHVSMLRKYDI